MLVGMLNFQHTKVNIVIYTFFYVCIFKIIIFKFYAKDMYKGVCSVRKKKLCSDMWQSRIYVKHENIIRF